MSIEVTPAKNQEVSFTHFNYEGVPDYCRPAVFVTSLRAPLAVSAAFVVNKAGITVGLAITGRRDKFCRATGRHIAATRLAQFESGQLSVDEQNKFIRFYPGVQGEELTDFANQVVKRIGYDLESEPAQLIHSAIINSSPLDQTADFISRTVRHNLQIEFGVVRYEHFL